MDILDSLKLWRYWAYRAHLSNILKYRASKLGLIWPILSLLAVTLVIGVIWGILLEKENQFEYFLYLLCGYPAWTILSGTIEQGCRDANTKIFGGIPYFTVILERAVLVFFPFLSMLPIILAALLWYYGYDIAHIAWFPAIFILTIFWVVGSISLLVAVISIVPDLRHFIGALMRLAFLATPIIWETSRLGEYEAYIWLNPFYIPLESIRSSLLGTLFETPYLWLYFMIFAALVFILGVLALKLRINKLSH